MSKSKNELLFDALKKKQTNQCINMIDQMTIEEILNLKNNYNMQLPIVVIDSGNFTVINKLVKSCDKEI